MRVIDCFDRAAEVAPDRASLITDGYARTFDQVRRDSVAISRALSVHGLSVGDRLGIVAPNAPEVLIAQLGLWRAGRSWVPLDLERPLRVTVELINEVGCTAVFLHESFADYLPALRTGVPALRLVASLGGGFEGVMSYRDFLSSRMTHSVSDWSDGHGNRDLECVAWPPDAASGRTSAVFWTNQVWTALTEAALRSWPEMSNAVNLLVAPMTHAAGVIHALVASAGSTLVIRPGFDPDDVLESIAKYRATHLFLPPIAFYALLDAQDRRRRDCTSLRMLLLSGAPVAPAQLARGIDTFGDCIAQC